jgi:hypothetical protein
MMKALIFRETGEPKSVLKLEEIPFQSSADGPREIRYAALCSTFDLFDSNGSRVVASALGALPAARRSACSDEQSPHHVLERKTYAAGDCAVFA